MKKKVKNEIIQYTKQNKANNCSLLLFNFIIITIMIWTYLFKCCCRTSSEV